MRHRSATLGALALAFGLASSPAAQAQGPQMPDPRAMSGIARVDPQLPTGQVTVRCLRGGFDAPAVGASVALLVQRPDGSTERFETQAAEQGRATFTGLEAFVGGTARASAIIDGEEVRSGPIPIAAQGGSRLLLVKGAASQGGGPGPGPGPAAGNPHGDANPHGNAPQADLPPFGIAFDLQGRAAGTVVVGVLDFVEEGQSAAEKIKPFADLEVRLFAVDGQGQRRLVTTGRTDAEGRANFTAIEHAEGESMVAETTLDAGGEPIVSAPFDVRDSAKAVVLLREELARELNRQQAEAAQQARGQAQPGDAPRGRRPMPPVTRDASLPPDRVRVLVVDKDDQPVEGVDVDIVRIDAARDEKRFPGKTGALGIVEIDVTDTKKDALYFVEVVYDEAPYTTHLFDLPLSGGASAALRVFERTEDPSKVRSAVHFEFDSLENDKARILVAYEVMVDGDQAYWPRGGMQMWGPRAATVAKPLPEAERWLEEVEDAPYAKLTRPIPPGEPIKLSMGFVAPHDGTLQVEWDAPFPLIGARVALKDELDLSSGGVAGTAEKIEHGAPEPMTLQDLELAPAAKPLCEELRAKDPDLACPRVLAQAPIHTLEFSVEGFVLQPPYLRWIALGVGSFIALVAALAALLRPRRSRAQVLEARRRELLARVKAAPAGSNERRRGLEALDRIYRQLEALGVLPEGESAPPRA